MHFRLLTLIIVACFLLLIVKTADIAGQGQVISEAFLAESLRAQEDSDNNDDDSTDGTEDKKTNNDSKKGDGEKKGQTFTKTELDILQRLSIRRLKLEEWQKDLEIKENVLNIIQNKIDQKISDLKILKSEVESKLKKYNSKEDEKIRRLVKVYESMKPASAAGIFAEMEMETLMVVASKMKEKNVALILAKMKPKLAKNLTMNIIESGQLKKQ